MERILAGEYWFPGSFNGIKIPDIMFYFLYGRAAVRTKICANKLPTLSEYKLIFFNTLRLLREHCAFWFLQFSVY